jgi:hypothetical protein
MVKRLNCWEYKEGGKEFKILYCANAAAAYDGNIPYIMANCLTQRQFALFNNYLPLFLTLATFFCGCYLDTTNVIKCNAIKYTHNILLLVSTNLVNKGWV